MAGILGACTAATADPSADFAARRQAIVGLVLGGNFYDVHGQAICAAAGQPLLDNVIISSCEFIDSRHDCADFHMNGVLRILHQFGESPLLTPVLRERMKATVLGFKYWPDEPGIDSMCTWSENHYILFSSAGYLAGQLYPDEVFTNSGKTGRELMAVHRKRIERWLYLRFHTGFSEWLSNVYYDEDLAAVLNLADFCKDEWIAQRAVMVTDLLLADIALNSFQGSMPSTHGRTYEAHIKVTTGDSTAAIQDLAFGGGAPGTNMSALSLALSTRYRVPLVLSAMANDTAREEYLNRQRMGIRIADAKRWGLGFKDPEDGMLWFTMEAYAHPKTINLTLNMFDTFNWWGNSFWEPFQAKKQLIDKLRPWRLMPCVARMNSKDLGRNIREQVDIYTYRTPDYMLSTAQDYHKGRGGDQQHIWQATIGPNAVCFTTHPTRRRRITPNYWTGYGTLPRAAQVENVVLEIYNINEDSGLYIANDFTFTHAWLPKNCFDEVIERDHWVFARKGDGHLALYSQRPTTWQSEGADRNGELIAKGNTNVWICELGRRATDGDFTAFMGRILSARLSFGNLRVSYDSPSQGLLEFGWRRPFTQNGKRVPLKHDMRYDNPYSQTPFASDIIEFRLGDQFLRLDWNSGERSASALL